MQELRQQYPLEDLLVLARLPRSSYYYQVGASRLSDKHAGLKAKIRALFHKHRGRYGYRRITLAIRNEGTVINRKTVQRLMQALGLKSLVRLKKYQSYRGEEAETAPNILERRFSARRPNEK